MFKKGDRVRFKVNVTNDRQEWVDGTIVKVNPVNYKVVQDGGAAMYQILHEYVETSRMPSIPVPDDCMKSWQVENYRQYDKLSEETVAFSADIYYRGKKWFTAENTGKGGTNKYDPVDQLGMYMLEEFLEECEIWICEHLGEVSHADAAATWIIWKTQYEGFNILPSEMLSAFYKSTRG